jgi:hypothetical protein
MVSDEEPGSPLPDLAGIWALAKGLLDEVNDAGSSFGGQLSGLVSGLLGSNGGCHDHAGNASDAVGEPAASGSEEAADCYLCQAKSAVKSISPEIIEDARQAALEVVSGFAKALDAAAARRNRGNAEERPASGSEDGAPEPGS